jgi:tRNA dimethylallyltransferase
MERIVCVVGPTASGKTGLAVELAKRLDGEIVSCDSMQIYRRMDIGTAKPTVEEMQGIHHYMIDIVEPDEDFSVGKYVEMAEACLQDILARGKTAVVAGGTGLYCDSLIAGRSFAPCPSTGKREALEREADELGSGALLERLRAADPETAARLHPADRKRIVRALEVYLETGETISAHNEKTRLVPPRHRAVWLGLDFEERAELYARIDRRVDDMLRLGLLDEIRALLASGVPEKATSMQAIGYKEFLAALRGESTPEEAAALVKQRSRNYAKRQRTWFRRNPEIRWLLQRPGADFSALSDAACQEIPFFA